MWSTVGAICPEPVEALLSFWGARGANSQRHPSEIRINGRDYSTVRVVGEGGFAFVYAGVCNPTGQRVALKRYVFAEDSQYQTSTAEISLYKSIPQHPNVVTYIDSDVVYRPHAPLPEMWTVMEFCAGPSLQDYINNRIALAQEFTVREVYELLHSVVGAIGHLHSQSPPISHWDIKPGNFLFADSGTLKLCDFGSATTAFYQVCSPEEISIAERELETRMTLLYRAPETLDLWAKKRIDERADIWALGVLVYALVFKEMPFEGSAAAIVNGVPKYFRDGTDDATPQELRPLMNLVKTVMLVKDPALRGDIFAVSEELSKVSLLSALQRPHPGAQAAQVPRFC